MKKIVLLANTFSVTVVFRRSLVEKLEYSNWLRGIFSLRRDYSSLSFNEAECFYPKKSEAFWRSWVSLISDSSVQLVHSFTHSANLLAVFSAIIFRKKVVLTVTGMGLAFGFPGIRGCVARSLIRSFYWVAQFFSGAIIVQNQDDFQELNRLFLERYKGRLLITAGSGIPLNYYEGIRPAKINKSTGAVVGFFSRALAQKGVLAYYTLARECASDKALTFIHIGHAGKGNFGRDRIVHTASSSNIVYLGSTLDLRPWLLAVDIVILPSKYREGLSRICIEAMLAGKIVVARETSGVRDHIQNGVTGFLYQSESDLIGVFHKALAAQGGPMHEKAKAYARESFDVDCVDATYFKAYDLCGMNRTNEAS